MSKHNKSETGVKTNIEPVDAVPAALDEDEDDIRAHVVVQAVEDAEREDAKKHEARDEDEAIRPAFTVRHDKEEPEGRFEALKESVSAKAECLKEAVSEKAEALKEVVSEKAGALKDAVSEKAGALKDAIAEKAGALKDAVAHKAGCLSHSAGEALSDLKSKVEHTLHKDPEPESK